MRERPPLLRLVRESAPLYQAWPSSSSDWGLSGGDLFRHPVSGGSLLAKHIQAKTFYKRPLHLGPDLEPWSPGPRIHQSICHFLQRRSYCQTLLWPCCVTEDQSFPKFSNSNGFYWVKRHPKGEFLGTEERRSITTPTPWLLGGILCTGYVRSSWGVKVTEVSLERNCYDHCCH